MEEDTQKKTGLGFQNFLRTKEAIAVCTKYFDEVVASQILLGCKQVVCLGSSLSDRFVEKDMEEVAYFQIAGVRQGATPDPQTAIYIPGSYIKDDLISLLESNSFDCDLPSCFLWEDEVIHLRRGEVILVLERIRDRVKNFQIALNYLSCQGISQLYDLGANELKKANTPGIFGFRNFETFAKCLGLKVFENLSIADLYVQYYSVPPPESHLLKSYFVCTLGR
jgi:O-methyltransferase involved in polyketide biosynthesis